MIIMPENTAHDEGALFDYLAGLPVLASRDTLAGQIAPVQGVQAGCMREASQREAERAASDPRQAVEAGLFVTQNAIALYRIGSSISTSTAATITVALRNLRVRDDAWSRMYPEHKEAHIKLWTSLTRLAAPGYVAAPASLLAFCAWQSGDGALANVALDRALADDPRYSMALLLRQVINSGAPPSMARLPMSPEDVAASYEDKNKTNQETRS